MARTSTTEERRKRLEAAVKLLFHDLGLKQKNSGNTPFPPFVGGFLPVTQEVAAMGIVAKSSDARADIEKVVSDFSEAIMDWSMDILDQVEELELRTAELIKEKEEYQTYYADATIKLESLKTTLKSSMDETQLG